MNDLCAIRIEELIRTARARRASDLHFGGDERPALRIDGRLIALDGAPVADDAILDFLRAALSPAAMRRLEERGTADGSRRHAESGAYRVHAFRHSGRLRCVIRLLSKTMPTLELLGLPAIVETFPDHPSGLILFTGPTGSGKTTALAALVDRMNRTTERNILTVEDPVEYVHSPARSLITHCEIGRDVVDYVEALRGFLRADPDAILVGEMRDRETIEAAMTAAETGHLVFSTLHTNDAPHTVDRIIDAFPSEAQTQVRAQLASVLIAVVSMRLVPRKAEQGRRAACEILTATDGVRTMIRDAKTHQLRNAIVTGRSAGMQTLETHLSELLMRGEIHLADALSTSSRPSEVRAFDRTAM